MPSTWSEGLKAGSFVVEYPKSGRSACKKCQKPIRETEVRFGAVVQSAFYDGTQTNWHHVKCGYDRYAGKTLLGVDEIFGVEALRLQDQEKLRKEFERYAKKQGDGTKPGFQVDLAKTNKSKCRGCEQFIDKGVVRVSFLYQGLYGLIPAWHHSTCFVEHHPGKAGSIKDFAGWENIPEEMRDEVDDLFKQQHVEKSSDKPQVSKVAKLGKAEAEQVKLLWNMKDGLNTILDGLNSKERKHVLLIVFKQLNIHVEDQNVHIMFDTLVDELLFGVTQDVCKDCRQSRLVWSIFDHKYVCPVYLEWGRCTGQAEFDKVELIPVRVAFSDEDKENDEIYAKLEKYINATQIVRRVYNGERNKDRPATKHVSPKKRPRKEEETKKRVLYKGGVVVDEKTELQETHHVYTEEKKVFSVIMTSSDVETGRNAFYKLQLLAPDDSKKSYYVFRSWGRVGAENIGDFRLSLFRSKDKAIEYFCEQFEEKSGNDFYQDSYQKKPKKFFPLEIVQVAPEKQKLVSNKPSKLSKSVQDLIAVIFDVELMKRAMLEMEIDLEKLPIGQLLSEKHIREAFAVLSEISEKLELKDPSATYKNLSNRFYTLVPHVFYHNKPPPLLDNKDTIAEKVAVLQTLLDISVADSLIKQNQTVELDENPLDTNYESLNAEIVEVIADSREYELISKSVHSTHAPTHTDYELEILKVFGVKRQHEEERFIKSIKNNSALEQRRMLLWHGSKMSNFVGILSQGLRIAPPEAPVTGYMFGKGIYFADMVSKSANYCCATEELPEGILLLCEVALGDMYELTQSEFIEELPTGKQSTKGCGKTTPAGFVPFNNTDVSTSGGDFDTKRRRTRKQVKDFAAKKSITIPVGPPTTAKDVKKSELLYNEYIVYEPDQVVIRYAVQVKFKFKKRRSKR